MRAPTTLGVGREQIAIVQNADRRLRAQEELIMLDREKANVSTWTSRALSDLALCSAECSTLLGQGTIARYTCSCRTSVRDELTSAAEVNTARQHLWACS